MSGSEQVQQLIDKGARIHNPDTVYIAPDVKPGRISGDITIFPGCRILGMDTSIGPSCSIGKDGPVTIDDCQLAGNVTLKGGTFAGATLLFGVEFGPGAHVRPATIMEEQSSCAQSVGLKQTVLFPFVTLGSLINFCDCFMSGGTSRRNHSEVGSSYIHFNYTPHQDKATASLIGDVPRGVMLNQPPIFLGGQGGLVGPATIEYGAITAAGTISRRNITETGKVFFDNTPAERFEQPYQPGAYRDISRTIRNNLIYIGNLFAMLEWYKNVRSLFIGRRYPWECHHGALSNIQRMLEERISRMAQLANNMPRSLEIAEQKLRIDPTEPPFNKQGQFYREWPSLKSNLNSLSFDKKNEDRDAILKIIGEPELPYLETIKSLDDDFRQTGTMWLQSIVESVTDLWQHP